MLLDGSFHYPTYGTDVKYLEELLAEAEYYGLTGLIQHINSHPVRDSTFCHLPAANTHTAAGHMLLGASTPYNSALAVHKWTESHVDCGT